MEQRIIPACYFPATVLFIDDDRSYLLDLRINLDDDKYSPKFCYKGKQALEFLQKYQPELCTEHAMYWNDTGLDKRKIEVDVPALREEIYDPERFSQISVIVVDHAMPDIKGLDLCKQLRDKPFKKLMLTGEADEKLAVEAFNQGVIDMFIRKNAPNFYELLNESIYQLQHKYFQEISTIMLDSIIADPEFPNISWLNDPVFPKLFRQICEENHVAEYYLTDTFGSYLFLDADAKPSWLAVKDESGMRGTYEIGRDSDTPFPSEMLEEIKSRKKVLYLYDEGGLTDDPEEAARSLHPATKLEGKNIYYYAYIKDPNAYDIHRDDILSYNEYLEKQKSIEL